MKSDSNKKETLKVQEYNSLLYDDFFHALLKGDRAGCSVISDHLLARNFPVKNIYEDFFRNSLYHIGELWEIGKITVATEHLASAIIEDLLNNFYPWIISVKTSGRSVVMSCVENEYHQIGLKMASDIFEMHHWNVQFLGANTPVEDLMSFIREKKPEILALSMSLYFHLPFLENILKKVNSDFPGLPVIVGGQAFRYGGREIFSNYSNISYIPDLGHLETYIKEFSCKHGKKDTD
jgi:MerR family transcriptional regulator, light-induced transcriptional regulator